MVTGVPCPKDYRSGSRLCVYHGKCSCEDVCEYVCVCVCVCVCTLISVKLLNLCPFNLLSLKVGPSSKQVGLPICVSACACACVCVCVCVYVLCLPLQV